PLRHQLRRQLRHCDVGLGLNPCDQVSQVGGKLAPAGRTPLACRLNRARLRYPRRKLYRKTRTHLVPPRRRTPPFSPVNLSPHPSPQLNRMRLSHACWPPPPARILNQISKPLGIPLRFLFLARCSRGSCVAAA